MIVCVLTDSWIRISIATLKRRLGRNPTVLQQTNLASKRNRLQSRINAFQKQAVVFFNGRVPPAENNTAAPSLDTSWDDIAGLDPEIPPDFDPALPENQRLYLPSSMNYDRDFHGGGDESDSESSTSDRMTSWKILDELREAELLLRQGQANDAVSNIQVGLADRSVTYRTQVRPSKSYVASGRAWRKIQAHSDAIAQAVKVYTLARNSMLCLGATSEVMERFRKLEPEHLKTDTQAINFNDSGTRNKTLSWIWTMDGGNNASNNLIDSERILFLCHSFLTNLTHLVARVAFLRAKSRRDRWEEERVKLISELDWTKRYFQHESLAWQKRGDVHDVPGYRAYAYRQAFMWSQFEVRAEKGQRSVADLWLKACDQFRRDQGELDAVLVERVIDSISV